MSKQNRSSGGYKMKTFLIYILIVFSGFQYYKTKNYSERIRQLEERAYQCEAGVYCTKSAVLDLAKNLSKEGVIKYYLGD